MTLISYLIIDFWREIKQFLGRLFSNDANAAWAQAFAGVIAILIAFWVERSRRRDLKARALQLASRTLAEDTLQRSPAGRWEVKVQSSDSEAVRDIRVMALEHVVDPDSHLIHPDWHSLDSTTSVIPYMPSSFGQSLTKIVEAGDAINEGPEVAHALVSIEYTDIEGRRWQRQGTHLPTSFSLKRSRRLETEARKRRALNMDRKDNQARRRLLEQEELHRANKVRAEDWYERGPTGWRRVIRVTNGSDLDALGVAVVWYYNVRQGPDDYPPEYLEGRDSTDVHPLPVCFQLGDTHWLRRSNTYAERSTATPSLLRPRSAEWYSKEDPHCRHLGVVEAGSSRYVDENEGELCNGF